MKHWLAAILMFTGMFGFSQTGQEGLPLMRIEIPARTDQETYRFSPCGDKGLLLFFRSVEQFDESRVNWYFTFYDTNLVQQWTKSIPLDNEMELRLQELAGDTLGLLFQYEGKNRDLRGKLALLRLAVKTPMLIMNQLKVPGEAALRFLQLRNSYAILGMNNAGQLASLALIRFNDGSFNLFQAGQGEETRLVDMQLSDHGDRIITVLSKEESRKERDHFLVIFDTAGRPVLDQAISTITPERFISDLRILEVGGDSLYMIGTYGMAGKQASQKEKQLEEATGVYLTRFQGNMQKEIIFINFLDLKATGQLMSQKDLLDLKKKAMKKGGTGEISLDFQLLLHEPSYNGDHLNFTAELFSPQYHTENFTDFDFYGRPYTNSYSVFDGYRFSGGLLISFNKKGTIICDQAVEIRNLVSFELTPKLSVMQYGQKTMACFQADGKIGSKLFKGSEVVGGMEYDAVDLPHPEDKLIGETRSLMVHWYGPYFLTSGYQEIKNILTSDNNKRLVFFLNKVEFGMDSE